jgi:hypothetical protein
MIGSHPRRPCPVCGRLVPITRGSGRLFAHAAFASVEWNARGPYCPGSHALHPELLLEEPSHVPDTVSGLQPTGAPAPANPGKERTMSESPFDTPDAPGSGDRFVNADHVGELIVVRVKGVEEGVVTDAGESDVIVADVTVIDGEHAGEQYHDCWLFGKVVLGQLKRKVGRTVLGRWYGEPGVKRGGKNVAYQLNTATEEETALALKAMNTLMSAGPAEATPASGGAGSSAKPATADSGDVPPWERRA